MSLSFVVLVDYTENQTNKNLKKYIAVVAVLNLFCGKEQLYNPEYLVDFFSQF